MRFTTEDTEQKPRALAADERGFSQIRKTEIEFACIRVYPRLIPWFLCVLCGYEFIDK